MKRLGILTGLILLLAIFLVVSWNLLTPLFFDRIVDEKSPFPSKEEVGMIMPPGPSKAEKTATRLFPQPKISAAEVTASAIITGVENAPAVEVTPTLTATIIATVTIEATPDTTPPTPTVLGRGKFVDGDLFHKGSGVATIYQMLDGTYLLRFEHFKATNGPDLHVLLSTNAAPTDHASLGNYLDLGLLKGNIGDQNYKLPKNFDPTQYKSVVIHCLAFQVIFATATLE